MPTERSGLDRSSCLTTLKLDQRDRELLLLASGSRSSHLHAVRVDREQRFIASDIISDAIEADIESARRSAGQAIDADLLTTPLGPSSDDRKLESQTVCADQGDVVQPQVPVISLGEAYDRYISDPTKSWSQSTREAYETCRNVAVSVIGRETPVGVISRPQSVIFSMCSNICRSTQRSDFLISLRERLRRWRSGVAICSASVQLTRIRSCPIFRVS